MGKLGGDSGLFACRRHLLTSLRYSHARVKAEAAWAGIGQPANGFNAGAGREWQFRLIGDHFWRPAGFIVHGKLQGVAGYVSCPNHEPLYSVVNK